MSLLLRMGSRAIVLGGLTALILTVFVAIGVAAFAVTALYLNACARL